MPIICSFLEFLLLVFFLKKKKKRPVWITAVVATVSDFYRLDGYPSPQVSVLL